MSHRWPKVFRDPIHNLIAFDDSPCDRLLLALINTREMQRLRRIKQMGTTELVFPGANHSRFAHSLGVLHTARLFLDQFDRAAGTALPADQRMMLLCAALLHDVGHGPFSHAFELVTGQAHELFTRAIVLDDATEVHQCLRAIDPRLPELVVQILDNQPGPLPPYLLPVVSGQLDADRCDYLLRDSHATGTNYGDFDLAWMIAQLRPDPDGQRFYLTPKGLSAVETYLFARFHMYRTVYFHKTSRAAEVMLKLLFTRLKELLQEGRQLDSISSQVLQAFVRPIQLSRYLDFDDHTVTELLKSCSCEDDATLERLAGGLLHRRLYKAIDLNGRIPPENGFTRELLARGIDPRYSFVEDSATDTPYDPYRPDESKPSRQIWVESPTGQIVEVSQLSDALLQLGRPYTMVRYYVPAECRAEALRLLTPGISLHSH